MPANTILILDDSPDVGIAAQLLLRRRFGEVISLQRPGELMAALERHRPEVLLLDLNFSPGACDGAEGLRILRQLAAHKNAPTIIVLTAYADIAIAVEAVKCGAFDFVTKPWDNHKLVATVAAALTRRPPLPTGWDQTLLGDSRPMRELRALIASVAPSEANVMILGENGSGKELVARAIHQQSHRCHGIFLAVDTGALPASTFESELFGHKKGSFTDARADRAGRFQTARGGTLFLDEIGNMPLENQVKLLTALERREVTPLGADRADTIDVRIVSATNLDEARLWNPQHFRADLLYRLNTIVLHVPPLRARREDIVPLAEHFLALYARQYAKPPRNLASTTQTALSAEPWSGNVRALRHACERAVILATGTRFEPDDFALTGTTSFDPSVATPTALRLNDREKVTINLAMLESNGNISEAAKLLGVSRGALYRKLAKHEL